MHPWFLDSGIILHEQLLQSFPTERDHCANVTDCTLPACLKCQGWTEQVRLFSSSGNPRAIAWIRHSGINSLCWKSMPGTKDTNQELTEGPAKWQSGLVREG